MAKIEMRDFFGKDNGTKLFVQAIKDSFAHGDVSQVYSDGELLCYIVSPKVLAAGVRDAVCQALVEA